MVFGLKDFVLGSVCFSFICILSCLMGQKKIVLKYIVFYVVIAAIQQLCIYLPQAIETILSIFTLFIRVMIPVVLFASTFIATTKVSELIATMYSLKIPRSITITFAMVLRFFPTFSEEIQKLKPIIRSQAAYAPPEVVDGKPPVYPYTPIKSSFEDAGSVEEMMMYTELQSAVHAMIQRLEYSFTFNPTLLTIPKRKQQVTEILEEAEKYIWRIKEEMRCA